MITGDNTLKIIQNKLCMKKIMVIFYVINRTQGSTKEDIGIEQQLYEIVRGKHFALSCLSRKFTEMIMLTN